MYPCLERYGLIWVALEEPRWTLPEIAELETAGWKTVLTGPFDWRCEASRQVENFTDLGHFPWVHPGLLGDPSRPVVTPPAVRTADHVLHYEFLRPQAPNTAITAANTAKKRQDKPSCAATASTCRAAARVDRLAPGDTHD